MPSSCVVPLCKSNYNKNGHNIKVYSFSAETELRRKWILAIKRDNFTPTKYSKVCQLHFNESDFLTTSKAVDPKTGNGLEVPLKIKS
ncbi:unnamed protein product [Larinioides sclopetarius]|uniref:THAP-type domain-containing protein n=1 Tax=Larinioides sclopetarius TaxID=280406 RepID=A0AAV2BB70_9ARAC